MLDIKNIVVDFTTMTNDATSNTGAAPDTKMGRLKRLKGLLDIKCAAYLRLCATKNTINRASDYHYLNLCVSQSTAPVNDIDYVHPVVKPTVDYASAVITKGLSPNGEIDFEFVPDNEADDVASRQATNMVSRVLNNQNDPHKFLHEWVMDAALHKNGMLMVKPVREKITMYREIEGTPDQLRAFEAQATEAGLKAQRQSRKKISVDFKRVMAETQGFVQQQQAGAKDERMQLTLDNIQAQADAIGNDEEEDFEPEMPDQEAKIEDQQAALDDSINRNTIYKAKYKLTGYNLVIQMRQIAQHYWVCDPNVTEIDEMPFCGFYDPMTVQEVTELYPDIDLEEFRTHAEYNMNGAYQAGSILNNLAIHARDSVPTMGIPVDAGASADPDARTVTILTCWDRFDIDGDGELELIEIVCSGSYIISAREVEFIPVANMNPKPLPGNFFGMSLAESVVPMQEYMTSAHRAEIQLGLLQSTARFGVKPDRVDFEQIMDGESAIFILDSKFNPATDIYPMPVPTGDIQFLNDSMNRIQNDVMAMVGMTTPQDVFSPEVMAPGNSGVKLQMAMSPNQIIQDDTVKNAGEGLKEAIWLVWRTLVQYGDDYGVKKMAALYHPEKKPEFLDYKAFDEFNFAERKQVHVSLALGMRSDENSLARLQIIKQAQTELFGTLQGMAQQGSLDMDVALKMKKPFSEILYSVGVKDADAYLLNEEQIQGLIDKAAEAAKNAQPSPDDQNKLAQAKLNNAKTIEIEANLDGTSAERQMEYLQIAGGHTAAGVE